MSAETTGLPAGLDASWVLRRELPCPRCGYNLTMRREPRCPECGLRFRWQALLRVRCPRCDEPLDDCDEARCPRCRLELDWPLLLDQAACIPHEHFEYARRPWRALWRVVFGVLRPGRFWRHLRIEHPPVRYRVWPLLFGAWIAAFAALAAGLPVMLWLASMVVGRFTVPLVQAWTRPDYWLAVAYLFAPLLLACALLPAFRGTLRGYRIRGDHMLRIVAYAGLVATWIYLALAVGYVSIYVISTWWAPVTWMLTYYYAAVALLAGTWLWFLFLGLRRYLRLSWLDCVALLVSTHAIAVLMMAVLRMSYVWF